MLRYIYSNSLFLYNYVNTAKGGVIMFSKRLEQLRYEKELTQQQMADILGITRQAYGNYENGKREPDFITIKKLASFFGVSLDYLLGDSDIRKTSEQHSKSLKEESHYTTNNNLPPVFDDLDPETIKILNRAEKLTPGAKEQLKEAIKWVFELDAREKELEAMRKNKDHK